MVIHHFNRIIRNKWIWGAFAVVISIFFAFEFAFTGDSSSRDRALSGAGELSGESVPSERFDVMRREMRGAFQSGEEDETFKLNRSVWKRVAVETQAEMLGLVAGDDEVQQVIMSDPSFCPGGSFDYDTYVQRLAYNRNPMMPYTTPEAYEAFLRRHLTYVNMMRVVAAEGGWIAPAELDRALADDTDTLTVRIASYEFASGDSVTLDDAALMAYYTEHTNDLALADMATIRYVKLPVDSDARLETFAIDDADIQDYYEAHSDLYEEDTTNGPVTKAIEEVRPEILKELRIQASLEKYQEDLIAKINETSGTATALLDEIAAAEGVEAKNSPAFTLDGSYKAGFMSRPSAFMPGIEGVPELVKELDPTNRFNIASSDKAVYLIEYGSFIPAHVPTFEEAKDIIRPDALKEAKAKAFKAEVEGLVAGARKAAAEGAAFDPALMGAKDVSTQIVFSVTAVRKSPSLFPDAMTVFRPASGLKKGEISDFIATRDPNRGLLVYLEDRQRNNSEAFSAFANARESLERERGAELFSAWQDWNLKRMDLRTTPGTAISEEDEEAGEEAGAELPE